MAVVAAADGFGWIGEGCEESAAMEDFEKEHEYWDADGRLLSLVKSAQDRDEGDLHR